jgi:hypothetical protein
MLKERYKWMGKDGQILYENCGVNGDMFPCMGKCCSKDDAGFKISYAKICPYCRMSTSLPYGPGLKTAIIFECTRLGYGRRITE